MFVSEIIDEASEILATTDQNKIFKKLTEAVQTLMESGHYFHINQEVDVCTGWDGQTITLPRGIEVPLGVNIDGSPTYFRGRLFQYNVNKGGAYNSVNWAWDDRGFVSTIMDIRQPSQLIAVAEHEADAGLQLRIVGTDSNNRELRTKMPDGSGVDGILVPVHAQSDFPYGTIIPDGVTMQTQSGSVSPITQLISTAVHQLVSGQSSILSLGTGVTNSVLIAGETYYIGVTDNKTIQLFQNAIDATSGTNPIELQSILGLGTVTLTDKRPISLLTEVQLQTKPTISISNPNEVTFTKIGTGSLPSPLAENTTYFAQSLDDTDVQIYNSISDAQNNVNPVLLSGNSGPFYVDLRKELAPTTILNFSVLHYFQNGDQVQAYTAGGTLPQPLIEGQNYFVHYISPTQVSIHTNASEAKAGVNPIILTTLGSGNNSIVKLINATVNIGQTSNITASGFNLSAPTGSGASATGVSVGAVTNVSVTSAGSAYPAGSIPIVTFSAPPTPPEGTNQETRQAQGYAIMVLASASTTNYTVGSVVITDGGLGYITPPSVTFSDVSGATKATAVAQITKSFVSYFNIVSGGTGYTTPPQVSVTGGGGSGCTAVATVANGRVTAINVITEGTGYTSNPSVTITPSTGVFVEFTSTGTLPTPLKSGTAYRAEPPLNSGGTFTIKDGLFNSITISDNGSGSFYLQLSRTFSVGFDNTWVGDFNGVPNGTLVQLSSDYLFPSTNPDVTAAYIENTTSSNTLAKLYADPQNWPAGATFPLSSGTAYTLITDGGSGYTQAPAVSFNGGGGSGAQATAQITNQVTSFQITNGGSGYITPPTIILSGGEGSGATVSCSLTGGVITSVQIQSGGSNYTSNPSALIGTGWVANASIGLNYQVVSGTTLFTCTTAGNFGTIAPTSATPNPSGQTAVLAVAGTQAIISFGISGVVIDVTITNGGSGYITMPTMVFTNALGDTTGFGAAGYVQDSAIQVVSLGSGQSYYAVRNTGYAKAQQDGNGGPSLLTPSSIQYLSNGASVQFSTSATNGIDGLPSPLTSANPLTGAVEYTISIVGNNVTLKDSTGANVIFASGIIPTLANGQMFMNVQRQFTASPATGIVSTNSIFESGQQVTLRASTGDSLPNGVLSSADSTVNVIGTATQFSNTLSVNSTANISVGMTISGQGIPVSTTVTSISGNNVIMSSAANLTAVNSTYSFSFYYYVGFLNGFQQPQNKTLFNLYNSYINAIAGGTTGLVSMYSTGNTATSVFYIDSILLPTLVKSVMHVEKPVTVGYISLYAYDYGRSNDMALIGQYHPSETNPKYRRIRIGKPCAWARIIYRTAHPNITSVYDYIPVENTRAIMAALHAVDLEDKDFSEQSEKYWAKALAYLRSQHESMTGHAFEPIQVDNQVYGDKTDPVIDSNWGYYYGGD
jgi:hypothetical protein